jgi:hypothetical protein
MRSTGGNKPERGDGPQCSLNHSQVLSGRQHVLYNVSIRVQYSRPCPNKVSCEPCLHVLEGSHLNGVDRLIDDTILSVQIRRVEAIALVDGLHGCVGLVETVRRNSGLAPRIACRVLPCVSGKREQDTKGRCTYGDHWQRTLCLRRRSSPRTLHSPRQRTATAAKKTFAGTC